MTIDTSEKDFEATIEGHILADGYTRRTSDHYDRELCVDADTLIGFLIATQPQTWEKLKAQHGEHVRERFLARLTKEIQARGTLDVLRKGVTDLGCRFELAYFRPETGLNPQHQQLYNANILSVVRQLHYSNRDREKSLDTVLMVNGLPILTAELKTPLKGQTVLHAMRQYRTDRDPREPLFTFGRCLAHFAVDTDLAYMTTHLRGGGTRFLPFNLGHNNGSGNPPAEVGFKTAYLWERVWQRDSLLEILNHFLQQVDVLDDKGRKTGEQALIFPRYHQLDAVRRLVVHARQQGPGNNYLIQHSAGSGKSNSIAWLSHRLAGLHDDADRRVFDSVIVVTDRRVLDRQLQQTVRSFEQVKGIVTLIEKHKAKELATALEAGSNIIVTTLQTFPFVVEKLGELAGQRFAVVIDEAHSSQTGEGSKSLKEVLSVGDLEEAEAEDDVPPEDDEDQVNAAVEEMQKKRGRLPNVSYFAFTATPKAKTMELFGHKRGDGQFEPFSLYSMRQAIEEGFILDVLKNYTTFKTYFGLLKKIEDDPRYDKKKAIKLLKSYADLHKHGIRKKTEVMVDHFDSQVRNRIDGKAKAMLVTRSRLHAVRFKQAFDRYIKERRLPYKSLVAFSGTVRDPDTGGEFTEAKMNGVPETATAEVFKQTEYRFLIAANKFQTGFDQPLLHTMYVDKKLGGVGAVQTLSRLNRTCEGKEDTLVLDFANEADEIEKAFAPYYTCTLLSESTDPNKLYDLKTSLENCHVYGQSDVNEFAAVYFRPKAKQEQLAPILDRVVEVYKAKEPDERADFRKWLGDYVRVYAFLSQLLTFADVELEKLYQFARHLYRKLPIERDRLPVEVIEKINMDAYRLQQTSSGEIKLMDEGGELKPLSDLGTGRQQVTELAPLSEIINFINDNYGTDFTSEDKVRHFADDMERRLFDNEAVRRALDPEINPSPETRKLAFQTFFDNTLNDMIDANFDIYKKIVDDQAFGRLFGAVMLKNLETLYFGTTAS